jgi:Gpi18-like mannosyltransferase
VKTTARRIAVWSSTPVGLACVFAAGLAIRLWLAPQGGFPGDNLVHQRWENQLATQDWSQFSDPTTFVYYPFLYALFALGQLTRIFLGIPPTWTLLKTLPIVADLGLAWVVVMLAERVTPPAVRQKFPVQGPAAAASLLNPAVFFVSALWGQFDSVGALLVLGSFLLFVTGPIRMHREAIGAVLFAVALAMKPQVGVVLPLMLIVLARRHLPSRSEVSPRSVALTAARFGALAALGIAVIAVSGLPFGFDLAGALSYYPNAPTYAFTSVNAFNFWGVLGFWRPDLVGPNVYAVLGLPAFWLGVGLFGAGTVSLGVLAWRALDQRAGFAATLVFAFAASTCLEFAVLTRIHERYLFFAIPPLAVFIARRAMRRALIMLSVLLVINLYFPYVYFVELYGQHTFVKIDFLYNLLFGVGQDSPEKKVLSLITGVACLVVAWFGWRWLRSPASGPDAREAAEVEPIRAALSPALTAGFATAATLWRLLSTRWADARGRLAEAARWRPVAPARADAGVNESWRRLRWDRLAPLSLVAFACGFNLWALNAEATPVHELNDASYHFAMLRWARAVIDQGKLPLDGWYPNLGLGLAQFHHYQSLPHVIGAYLSLLSDTATTFYWVLYLLLALWPISVYLGARWMGWDGWTAGAAALVSPILISVSGYGYEHGSYTWRGYGTWSQLWGMWLLPLAWGLSWRAVKGVGSLALGALAVALTVACHLLTGYLALLSIGVWVLVAPVEFVSRLRRAAAVGIGALVVGSWVVVPLLVDSAYAAPTRSGTGPTIFYDSYGASQVLSWLVSGQLFDNGRLPIVSVLLGMGLAVCVVRFRRDERARALISVWVLSLLLFFGRPTLGPLLKILPGSDDLPLHRYINGVHLAGILLAAIGAAWLGRWLFGMARRYASPVNPRLVMAALAAIATAALYPAWNQVSTIDQQDTAWIPEQVAADATDGADVGTLIDQIKTMPPGRVYAGSSSNWGRDYKVGFVPMFAELQNFDVDTIGFWLRTESLSTDMEDRFDETNAAQYDLFNVRYMILPNDHQAPVNATYLAAAGRHRLYRVATSGYMEVVDSIGGPIVADRRNIGDQTSGFLESQLLPAHQLPLIAFNGADAPAPSLPVGAHPSTAVGSVQAETSNPAGGSYVATVFANRPAMVMLKTTFEPRWHAMVDGAEVKTQMIAPDFVSVPVPAGTHEVAFTYQPYPYYLELLALGLMTLSGLHFARSKRSDWTRQALRRRRSPPRLKRPTG